MLEEKIIQIKFESTIIKASKAYITIKGTNLFSETVFSKVVDMVILKVFVRDLGWDKYTVGQDISPAENVGWATRRALRFALGLEIQYKTNNICGSLLIYVFQVWLQKGLEMMPSQHMACQSQFSKYHSSLKGTMVTLRNSRFQESPRGA